MKKLFKKHIVLAGLFFSLFMLVSGQAVHHHEHNHSENNCVACQLFHSSSSIVLADIPKLELPQPNTEQNIIIYSETYHRSIFVRDSSPRSPPAS